MVFHNEAYVPISLHVQSHKSTEEGCYKVNTISGYQETGT